MRYDGVNYYFASEDIAVIDKLLVIFEIPATSETTLMEAYRAIQQKLDYYGLSRVQK